VSLGDVTTSDLTVSGAFTSLGIDDNANATAITIDSSENVGIGTTAPSAFGGKVVTVGSQTTGGSTYGVYSNNAINQFLKIGINGDQAEITWDDGDFLTLGTRPDSASTASLTEYMRITSTGNVGIGQSNPTRKLWVEQTDGVNNINGVFKTNSPVDSVIAFSDGTSTNGDFGVRCGSNGDNFSIFTDGANERLTVGSTGNVGIGDSDPAEKLTVAGNVRINKGADDTNGLTWDLNTTNFGSIKMNAAEDMQFNIRTAGTSNFIWSRDAAEYMRIDSTGNVGIGTSAPSSLLSVAGNSQHRIEILATDTTMTNGADYGGLKWVTNDAANPYLTTWELFQEANGTTGASQLVWSYLGNEYMRLNGAGNLGVGTSTPAALLSAEGSSTGEVKGLILRNADGGTSGQSVSAIFEVAAGASGSEAASVAKIEALRTGGGATGDLLLHTTNAGVSSEALRINSAGNVGIGTDTPLANLDVADFSGPPAIYISNMEQKSWSAGQEIGRLSYYVGDVSASGQRDAGGMRALNNANAAGPNCELGFFTSDLYVAPTEKLRIDSAGNVGIGESDPTAISSNATTLSIKGKVPTKGGSIRLQSADESVSTYLYPDSGNGLTMATQTAHPMRFLTSNTEAMRIDTSGNLLIGTNVGTGPRLRAERSGIVAEFNRSSGTSSLISFQYGGVDAGYITSSAGGTPSFVAASDERLKDNIVDHESELANVMSLRPTRWDWKDEAKGSGEGFIAQELEATAWSDLVTEGDDGFKQVSGLGAVETRLIKAMQEQQALIEALTAKVEALENA
jgi:hypothetical protein